MEFEKKKTACFSGYRPHKFNFPLSGDIYDKFVMQIMQEITEAVEGGYNTFIIGLAPGFDIIAGEQVVIAKRFWNKRGVKLIGALPYWEFCYSKHFDESWRDRFLYVLENCDGIINVNKQKHWSKGCYEARNKFMVDNSSLLICYHTDKSGGTASTVRYADSKGLAVVNISERLELK